MRFYFSGIRTAEERAMLEEAGVRHILVDPWSFDLVRDWAGTEMILDSGAYRVHKEGIPWSVTDYAAFLDRHAHHFTHLFSLDRVGNPTLSHANFLWLRAAGYPVLPVWPWGSPRRYLLEYLDASPLVGIGTLVPVLREAVRNKDDTVLRELAALCEHYPQRFHLFGCFWPKALQRLRSCAAMADSSEWLAGARKGLVLFVNRRTGHLSRAPYRVLPFAREWDRRTRCIQSARVLDHVLNPEAATSPLPHPAAYDPDTKPAASRHLAT